jgi:hypothetical protein
VQSWIWGPGRSRNVYWSCVPPWMIIPHSRILLLRIWRIFRLESLLITTRSTSLLCLCVCVCVFSLALNTRKCVYTFCMFSCRTNRSSNAMESKSSLRQ